MVWTTVGWMTSFWRTGWIVSCTGERHGNAPGQFRRFSTWQEIKIGLTVVVHVLSGEGRARRLRLNRRGFDTSIVEASSLLLETATDLGIVAVVEVTLLNGGDVVLVRLGEHLTVLDRLDRGVMVVLVNLAVCRRGRVVSLRCPTSTQLLQMGPGVSSHQRQSESRRGASS